MRYLIPFLFFSLLNASSDVISNVEIDDISNNSQSSIQDKVLGVKSNTRYEALNLVFSNYYIDRVLKGFISYIEEVFLKIDIRRISLDLSSTNINVSDEYRDLQVNQFNRDNSIIANFNADLSLEYNFENSRLSTGFISKYGTVILTPNNKPSSRTETADDIVLNIGYTRKALQLNKGFIGPFIDGEYQTEFSRNLDSQKRVLPRSQVLRYKAGIRMLDNEYIDDIYLAGVGEFDLSYHPNNIKGAIETGIRAKTLITNNIKLIYQGFYRQYVGLNIPRGSDLLYNVNLTIRLDAGVYKGFALSPFISGVFAKIKAADKSGSNITMGIALLYSNSINAISSIQSTQNARLKQYYKSINER